MKWKSLWILALATAIGLAYASKSEENKMLELKYDLHENIVEVAKNSGAPKYTVENVAGLVSYHLSGIPDDVTTSFTKNGFEINVANVSNLTLYADANRKNNMMAQALMLQFSTDSVTSHKAGYDYFNRLARKFRNSKWRRYIDTSCPAVSGRSAYLDEVGTPGVFESCSLDPGYDIPLSDWIELTDQTQRLEWIGDGVIATLSVRYSNDTRGITYSVDLDFEDYALKRQQANDNLIRKLSEGDKQGWKSTESYKKGMEETKIKVKLLEANAVRRGDHLVARD